MRVVVAVFRAAGARRTGVAAVAHAETALDSVGRAQARAGRDTAAGPRAPWSFGLSPVAGTGPAGLNRPRRPACACEPLAVMRAAEPDHGNVPARAASHE
ncbi:hypothetical protein C7S13_5556 [Burkholderia cepacia]|nr:hypothetical protein [Burkholderia cepacia]